MVVRLLRLRPHNLIVDAISQSIQLFFGHVRDIVGELNQMTVWFAHKLLLRSTAAHC